VSFINDSTNISSVGILLRGESIKDLSKIVDNFEMCFIVNWHKDEFDNLGKYILGKNIIQYTNLKHCKLFPKHIYEKYNIKIVAVPFCKNMMNPKRVATLFREYRERGIKEIVFLPEKYIEELELRPRNTGITCLFYCSEVLSCKKIWVAGLDFYTTEYLLKRTPKKSQRKRLNRQINMVGRFIKYLETFSTIEYVVLSQYESFLKLNNLKVIVSEGREYENSKRFSQYKDWRERTDSSGWFNCFTIGVNNITDFFLPNYHLWTNTKRFRMFGKNIHKRSDVLLGAGIHLKTVREVIGNRDYTVINFTDMKEGVPIGYKNGNGKILGFYRTAGNLSIMIAHLMGAKQIDIVGMDGHTFHNYEDVKSGKKGHHCYTENYEPFPKEICIKKDKITNNVLL